MESMLLRVVLDIVALYLRRFPWEIGRWRVLHMALPLSRRLLRGGTRMIRTRYGFRLCVDLSDWLGQHVYVTGDYEPSTSRVMQALLQAGDTVLDIGANIGYFTLLAAKCVGSAGRVFSFEPVPSTRQQLITNLQINDCVNAIVHEEALSDHSGESILYEGPPNHRGLSSLRPLTHPSRVLQVRMSRFDDLLPEVRVNLIKIDVEGAELQVLDGMNACLERDRPDLILEVSDQFLRALGHSADMLCRKLLDLDYRMYVIDYDSLILLPSWSPNLPEQFNALFTCRSQLPTVLQIRQY